MTVSQDQTCSVQVSDFNYGVFYYWVNATKNFDGSTEINSSEQRKITLTSLSITDYPKYLVARRRGNQCRLVSAGNNQFAEDCENTPVPAHVYNAWYNNTAGTVGKITVTGGTPPYLYTVEPHNADLFYINSSGFIKVNTDGSLDDNTPPNPFTSDNNLTFTVTDSKGINVLVDIPVVVLSHMYFACGSITDPNSNNWEKGDDNVLIRSNCPNGEFSVKLTGWNLNLVNLEGLHLTAHKYSRYCEPDCGIPYTLYPTSVLNDYEYGRWIILTGLGANNIPNNYFNCEVNGNNYSYLGVPLLNLPGYNPQPVVSGYFFICEIKVQK